MKPGNIMRMSARPNAEHQSAFGYFCEIGTRWMDNDVYGHVNNVVYYAFFDTAINQYLIENDVLDVTSSKVIGLVVETQCRYLSSVSFQDKVRIGVRVAHLGNSSVRYELGVFRNEDEFAAAQGHFVHVYVARSTNRPVALPDRLRRALAPLCRPAGGRGGESPDDGRRPR